MTPETQKRIAEFRLSVFDRLKEGKDYSVGGPRLRCSWEVVAGVLPGTPMPEYTRQWHMGSDAWEQDILDSEPLRDLTQEQYDAWIAAGNKNDSRFIVLQDAAHMYAQQITDPRYVNWVRTEFIWY